MWIGNLKKDRFSLFSYINLILIFVLILVSFITKNIAAKSVAGPQTIEFGRSELTVDGENLISLNKESVSGAITDCENQDTLFYCFTSAQKETLRNQIESQVGAAIEMSVFDDGEKKYFYRNVRFGFLYESSFKKGKVVSTTVKPKPQVSLNFALAKSSEAKISMCISKLDEGVVGFYVYGERPFHINDVRIVPARIGWDSSTDVPVWAFGSDGGRVDAGRISVDFSSGKKIFATKNSKDTVMPKIEFELEASSLVPIEDGMDRLTFKYGNENYLIRRSSSQNMFTVQTSVTKDGFALLKFMENPSLVKSIFMKANDESLCPADGIVDAPFVSDVGMIIVWPESAWRTEDYELFRWEQFPDVLVFDFSSYAIQNKFMTRLAYYIEKKDYKGTFVDDDFIESKRSYNAHDYKADDLAVFFTEAVKQNVRLNDEEKLLRKILVKNGVIIDGGDGTYLPGRGAIISMSKESWIELRYQLMAHETWHGIYFTDEEFREFSDSVFKKTNPYAIDFLKAFFSSYESLRYDTGDEYLMRNEFMAYMLQQTPDNTQQYFSKISMWNTIGEKYPDEVVFAQKTGCEDFKKASSVLCDYVSKRWGFWGGRTYMISKFQEPS